MFIEAGGKILVVGDLHLGYEEHLNRMGIFVSRQMFEEMISYFDKVFDNNLNWRTVSRDGVLWVQIRKDDGMWIWPDCSYYCSECNECLGCIRKTVIKATYKLITDKLGCSDSSDGLHHVMRLGEENGDHC